MQEHTTGGEPRQPDVLHCEPAGVLQREPQGGDVCPPSQEALRSAHRVRELARGRLHPRETGHQEIYLLLFFLLISQRWLLLAQNVLFYFIVPKDCVCKC